MQIQVNTDSNIDGRKKFTTRGRCSGSHIGRVVHHLPDLLKEQHQIASYLEGEAAKRRRVLKHTFAEMVSISRSVNPRVQFKGRIKSVDSILGKMSVKGAVVHQILDIIGIRAIFQRTRDCYQLVNRIHSKFQILKQEYDDYIAFPKLNGYRSIHTTVISSYGFPVEIQIRTQGMHLIAERGSASHVQYKKGRVLWMPVPPFPNFHSRPEVSY